MTTYLQIIPLDLQKEVTKKRYLEVLEELESVTSKIRLDLVYCYYPPDTGIRLRVTAVDPRYFPNGKDISPAIPDQYVVEQCFIYEVYWDVGYSHSMYSFQTLSKMISKN
jgi:hypothetical protein